MLASQVVANFKKKLMKKLILFILSISLLFACDIVNKPYIEQNGNCGHDNLSVPIKKVLIEDYTGHKCGNCPQAHEKLQELINNYCDHIVPVSIHVGYFASPSEGNYSTDFRTKTGNALNDYFGNDMAGLPNGMVNRTKYNGSVILSADSWGAALAEQLKTKPLLDVNIHNSYDKSTRKVSSKIDIEFLSDMNKKLMLNVWVIEDSIIDYQKDYNNTPVDIPDYVHRHVLRAAITPTWGENVLNGHAQINQIIEKNFSFNLDSSINENHCHIVAFVSDEKDKTILQADDEKIIQ